MIGAIETIPKAMRKKNLILIVAGVLLIIAGLALMAGPGTTETAFCSDIFSHRRIHVAPMVCLAGYLLEIVGILADS